MFKYSVATEKTSNSIMEEPKMINFTAALSLSKGSEDNIWKKKEKKVRGNGE